MAGAIVMYDRMRSMAPFADRPMTEGGPLMPLPKHVQGGPVIRTKTPKS
jgi:hypothetical protein